MSRDEIAPCLQTMELQISVAVVRKFAGIILSAAIVVGLPSTARSQPIVSDSARHMDTSSAPPPRQMSPAQTWAKALGAAQTTMILGVAGLPGTQLPPLTQPTLKSLAVQSVEGTKTTPPENTITFWDRVIQYRLWSHYAFAASTIAWLLYRLRHKAAKGLREGLLWFDAKALGVRRIVQVDELDRNAVMTPAAVRQRGWSQELMIDLLGPPDFAVLDPSGLNQPLILISRQRVEALERSDKVRAYRGMRARQAHEEDLRLTKWNELHGEFLPFPLVADPESVW
jgi:hypothetical protein